MPVYAPRSDRFPATAWSCVAAAGDPQHPRFDAAINRLIEAYWRPVYHFVRRKYPGGHDHEEMTQGFFFTLVTRGLLARADQARGRFRDFLLAVLKRFAFDVVVRPPRQARFEQRFVSIHALVGDGDRAWQPRDGQTPEEAFEAGWRASLLLTVRRNLESHYAGPAGQDERRFEIFAALHLVPDGQPVPSQEEVAARFGVSRDQVRYAAEQVRKRAERLLRQEIRDQVGADVDVEEEVRRLGS